MIYFFKKWRYLLKWEDDKYTLYFRHFWFQKWKPWKYDSKTNYEFKTIEEFVKYASRGLNYAEKIEFIL